MHVGLGTRSVPCSNGELARLCFVSHVWTVQLVRYSVYEQREIEWKKVSGNTYQISPSGGGCDLSLCKSQHMSHVGDIKSPHVTNPKVSLYDEAPNNCRICDGNIA